MGKHLIHDDAGMRRYIQYLESFTVVEPLQAEIKEYKPKRSMSQNSLYWVWMDVLAKHFSKKAPPYTKDQMHDIMRHAHLGYEDRLIGNTTIKGQLVSTTELTTEAMAEYMTKVEAWAVNHGCLLPVMACKEYEQYREAHL